MTITKPIAEFPLTRAASALALVGLIAATVAAAVVSLIGAEMQLAPAMSTAAVCLIAALAALWPVCWRAPIAPEGAAQGFLIGMVFRMIVCLGAVIGLAALTDLSVVALALWMLVWYLLLLVVEVGLLVGYLRRRDEPAPRRTEDAA